MRFIPTGLISLLILTSSALGQITGEVESIGFNSVYRPDCFTPMVIRIKPQAGMGGLYTLEVKQKDLDGDDVNFTRPISITGDESSREQRFSMYFLPQPSGLPDPQAGATLRDLQKELKVFLYKNDKQIATLPITSSIINIDPPRGAWGMHRGTRMILAVSGNGSAPCWNEYQDAEHLLGEMEDVVFVPVAPRDLPENPVAYDSVDAVVWMNVDPAELKRGGEEKFQALQSYVRRGGHLVICQSPQWQQYLEFGDLLPVTLQGIDSKKTLEPLRTLAHAEGPRLVTDPKNSSRSIRVDDPWDLLTGPYTMAKATAKPNTVIDQWIQWDDAAADRTPYIVRQTYGLGGITWVAQDLGDPAITSRTKTGWVYVWDAIFDWKNSPIVVDKYTTQREKDAWARAGTVDMGKGLLGGLNAPGTVSALLALAVAFFIVYWIIAGPGLFAYLVNKHRQNLSWFGFTLSAMAATLVTVVIVKLVVRGPPKLNHSTIIEQASGQPAMVHSHFGLYIKRDGDQRIQIKDNAPNEVTTLTALPKHPDYMDSDADSTSAIEYDVPVRDAASEEPAGLTIYYRSTQKQFAADWVGQISGKIEGSAKLVEAPQMIQGVLTNGTGHKLENVYIAFKYPGAEGGDGADWLLWIKSWDIGVTLDLGKTFYQNDKGEQTPIVSQQARQYPGAPSVEKVRGRVDLMWQDGLWNPSFRSRTGVGGGDGAIDDMSQSFVLLSLFDRLHPLRNEQTDNTADRVDLLRRGARRLDRSAALAAGGLVVLAESRGPIPVPVEVEGDSITGDGPIYYQAVLPLDRDTLQAAATTQPAN